MHKHRDGLTERAALWWGERLVAHRLMISCVAVRVVELPIVLEWTFPISSVLEAQEPDIVLQHVRVMMNPHCR